MFAHYEEGKRGKLDTFLRTKLGEPVPYIANKMKICHVVNAVSETSIPADIALKLNEQSGVDADILAWFTAERFDGDDILEVHCLDSDSNDSRMHTFRNATAILSKYDVIHTHHPHSGTLAKILGSLLGIPIVVTENSIRDRHSIPGRVGGSFTNLVADRVVCVSETVYESLSWFEKIGQRNRPDVIYNGVDIELIQSIEAEPETMRDDMGIADGSFLIGNAATFKPVKSHETLIKAVERANDAVSRPVELVIAGNGERSNELQDLACERNIRGNVHFVGLLDRTQVYRLMRCVDCFAMPSRSEAFCVAVAEAMATQTPCILSDIPTFREVFGSAAQYHTVDDHVDLAEQIIDLLSDSGKRDYLGRHGKDLVENRYTLQETAFQYRLLYDSIT